MTPTAAEKLLTLLYEELRFDCLKQAHVPSSHWRAFQVPLAAESTGTGLRGIV